MASFSSHILDATNGRSAAGIRVQGARLGASAQYEPVFDVCADQDGRISVPLEISPELRDAVYEIVFHSGAYFDGGAAPDGGTAAPDAHQIMRTIVLRITMPEAQRRYHIPVIISPHAYSTWWSG